jgi:tetratricopeptide (TPR) repeat protein
MCPLDVSRDTIFLKGQAMKRIFKCTLLLIMTFAVTVKADEDLGQLLESGIYQEQTVGDLDAAIKYYQQVVSKNTDNRKLGAQALYRLIQCYLKQNKPDDAHKALNTLSEDYAPFKEIIVQARKLLPDMLQMGDVPWPNHELMTLKLRSQSGMELGAIFYSAHRFGPESHDLSLINGAPSSRWFIQSHMVVPVSNLTQHTVVIANEKTFAPIQGITTHSMLGRFVGIYQDQKVDLLSLSKTGDSKRTFEVPKQVFDNEQVIYLIRRLPLAKDYQAMFPIFPVTSGQLVECHIKVIARENVDAAGKQYDCWKVDLKVKANGVTALNHQLWLGIDKPHLLVKYDSGNAVVMLLDDVRIQPLKPTPVEVVKGLSLTQPVDWQFYVNPNPGQYKASVNLLSSTQTWGMFLVSENSKNAVSLQTLVKQDVKSLESYFTDYKVNESSWKEHKITSMDAITYVADYKEKNQQMIEYRTYLANDSHVMWFVFRSQQDRFEANRKVYDQIIGSLNVTTQSNNASDDKRGIPYITDCFPKPFVDDLDPETRALSVTFTHQMMDQSWSWTGGGKTFPKITGDIQYDATQHTCTLPVKLEPGTVYWVGINSPSHQNFKSHDRKPAQRYVLLFATKGVDDKATPIPFELYDQAHAINTAHDKAAKFATDHASAISQQAWEMWQRREYPQAELVFQHAVDLDPTQTQGLNGLGWSEFNQGKVDQAEKTFERLLEIEPTHAAALNGMGWIYKGRDQWEKAIEYWEKAVQSTPNATAALNGLATVYTEHGEYDKAVIVYEQWLKVQPNSQQVKDGLTAAYRHLMVNWVEKFYSENFRDIAGRKKLEWGTPTKSDDGMLNIRYKYQATFKNNQSMIIDQRFTFTPEGKFVSVETIEKTPVVTTDNK